MAYRNWKLNSDNTPNDQNYYWPNCKMWPFIVQFQKKNQTHPKEGHWKFLGRREGGGGGGLKQSMKLNWNFLGGGGGGGVAKQKTFHGGVWIFSGAAH